MHTAKSLSSDMFAIELDGVSSDVNSAIDWQLHDRLGIVVTSPLGGLGASLLMQLSVCAYYDARPTRRASPSYAELHVFHYGGRYGDFTNFDLRPARKEIFVEKDGDILGAINAHAITHLLVPDAREFSIEHTYKEAEAAHDRIRRCFAYSPTGRVLGSDLAITALSEEMIADQENTLNPHQLAAMIPELLERSSGKVRADTEDWATTFTRRVDEVSSAERVRMKRYREAISNTGLPRETYRRITVDSALNRLYCYCPAPV